MTTAGELLAHHLYVLECERDALESLHLQARQAIEEDYAEVADELRDVELAYNLRIETIVRYELAASGDLIALYEDDSGWDIPERAELTGKATVLANFLERRLARLTQVIDELRARRDNANP